MQYRTSRHHFFLFEVSQWCVLGPPLFTLYMADIDPRVWSSPSLLRRQCPPLNFSLPKDCSILKQCVIACIERNRPSSRKLRCDPVSNQSQPRRIFDATCPSHRPTRSFFIFTIQSISGHLLLYYKGAANQVIIGVLVIRIEYCSSILAGLLAS